jgi:outer membrane protein insertion porin family/translocation and assembly module TamA
VALAAAGCAHPPPVAPAPCGPQDLSGCLVGDVTVLGTHKLSREEVVDSIVTGGGDHAGLSGLWSQLTGARARLDPLVLDRDLERVERLYRAHGYYEAHVQAARVRLSSGDAKVAIVVQEGPPVVVDRREITWEGTDAPPAAVQAAVARAAEGVTIGDPIEEESSAAVKEKIVRALADAGYAYAGVRGNVQVDVAAHRAHVTYAVTLGPACTFGPITLERKGALPWGRIQEVIGIAPGEPYGRARIDEAIAALSRLGVFASVEGLPQLAPENEPRRTEIPVVFRVTPASPRSFRGGVGAEAGSRVEAHVAGSFEHRNLFGQLGRLTLEARLGLVLYPLSLTTSPSGGPLEPLPEARLRADLVQPLSLPSQTNALAGVGFSMYELLPSDLLGYFEVAGKAGVERSFWRSRIHVALLGKLQYDLPFLYPGVHVLSSSIGYGAVTIPLAELDGTLDLRKGEDGTPDPVRPHSGVYVSADTQVAGLDTEDVRVHGEVRGYVPIAKRWTLAMRLKGGLLRAFGGPLAGTGAPTGACDAAEQQKDDCAHFLQLLQLRGFQSGGPDSNRGYAYGGVGPHEPTPLPSGQLPWSQFQGGKLSSTGGDALWEASVELRFPVVGDLGGAVFLDGSDVWRLDQPHGFAPHLSTGLSARYFTPIGPLRADVGVRIPGAQEIGASSPVYDPTTRGSYLSPAYGQAGTVGGLPLAIALTLGESF